jgi:hypothetical protein
MDSQFSRLAWGVSLASILVATSAVAADSAAAKMPSAEGLPALCRAAKGQFRPLAKTDIEQAKIRLLEAVGRLDQRLIEAGPSGDGWRKYLQWESLQNELRRPQGPDAATMTKTYQRYAADADGLELVWFIDVQQALRNYLAIAKAVDNPQTKTAYDGVLDSLATHLQSYARKPTTDGALAISEALRWLTDAGQAPELVQAIQHYYVRPNVVAALSEAIVGAGIAAPVDDTMPVRDCILGTDLHATAHTVGQTTVELCPNAELAVVDAMFFGATMSATIGYHGPVTAQGDATTTFGARKRMWIDADGLYSHPAVSNAVTQSVLQDIQSNRGRQMVEKMAWRRADKQHAETDCIAARHAEQRLNQRIDQQAEETLQKANEAYESKFRQPFREHKVFPQNLQFSTTEHVLRVVGLEAGNSRLAAPTAPPPVVEGADMSLCVHESMVNNLAADALAGRTVHEQKVQSAAVDLLGRLPERMRGDDDGQPWAILFARRQPISVSFADGGYTVTIRGAKYIKGEDAHPGMNVSATYKITKSPQGFKAVRQGEIEVFPPGFVPGKGETLSGRQQVIRRLLAKRFAKVFEPEIVGEGFVLPGKWEAAGKMLPIQCDCRDGWLVAAWKRGPTEAKPAAKVADTGG